MVYWACWKVWPGYLGEMEEDGKTLKAVYPDDEDCVIVRHAEDETDIESGGGGSAKEGTEKQDGSVDVYEV